MLTVGRRPSCDVCLPFPNISGLHCELSFRSGYWFVRDLNSTNGLRVNGERVTSKPLQPGDELSIGKRLFRVEYDLSAEGRKALSTLQEDDEQMLGQSLMEKAGLVKRRPDDDDD